MLTGLKAAADSELRLPDGINIVLNAIITNESYDLYIGS